MAKQIITILDLSKGLGYGMLYHPRIGKLARKILRSGDSKVAALPPDWLRIFRTQVGDVVDVFYDSIVIIKPRGFQFDAEFLLKEFSLILELEKVKNQ